MASLQMYLNRVAVRQHSLVTRADLHELGATSADIRRLLELGQLESLGRRTFGVGGVPLSPVRRLMLACLDTGGVAGRESAAWLHGIEGFDVGARPSVVVHKRTASYRTEIAEVHASSWLPVDDTLVVQGVPCLSVARTLFSLAAAVPILRSERVASAVDVAIRDGKASDAWLWWTLERIRRRGRNGVTAFEAILDARAGGQVTESWLERELLRLLAAAGIPLPVCQRRIERAGAFVARVDFLFEDLRLVIEVSGHRYHSTRLQQAADARRRNELQLAGYLVIEFTYDDLVRDPTYVVGRVRSARAAAQDLRRAG